MGASVDEVAVNVNAYNMKIESSHRISNRSNLQRSSNNNITMLVVVSYNSGAQCSKTDEKA